MTSVNFVLLVVAGSLGILLCFVQARSRAVFAEDGFAEPGRRALAMGLLGAVLVLVVAIPFAGGIGLVGWVLTILTAAVILGISYVLSPKERGGPAEASVSPMIVWLVAQPVWVKVLIVLSAMIVEELFFRGFLQPRVGPVAATLMFTAAHGAYGQPLVLVGILVIAAVLAVTFALYRNVLPCVMAHGVFDAIQMFVIIPLALRSIPGF